jgi:hypothetical protein
MLNIEENRFIGYYLYSKKKTKIFFLLLLNNKKTNLKLHVYTLIGE